MSQVILTRTRQCSAVALVCTAVVLFSLLFVGPSRSANRSASGSSSVEEANSCVNMSMQVVTDPTGDQNPGQPAQLDVQAVSVGEDYQFTGLKRLVFVLKVANLTSVPTNGIWRVRWTYTPPAGTATTYHVSMLSDSGGAVRYEYGTYSGNTVSTSGSADEGSFTPDGTIRLSIARNKVGNPADVVTLTAVNGQTQSNLGGVLFLAVDSTSSADYTTRAQDPTCVPAPLPTPTPAGTPTATDPRFQNYTPPATASFSYGEPSIGANWQTGKLMYLAGFNAIRISLNDCSSPARDTWTNASPPGAVSLDPIMFTDHFRLAGDTRPNRTFVSQLTGQDSITFFTDDDGASYLPSQGGGIPSGVDHQTIGAGPYHTPFPVNPVYPNAVYYCSQDIAASFCARSDDGGITFGAGVPMYNLTQCTGIHGHVKVAPDGTVYVPNRSCAGKAAVVRSTDNGTTWAVKPIPTSSTTGFLVDPSVGIGQSNVGKPGGQPSNTIYLGYQASDGRARIAVSRDQGDNWTNDQDVGTSFALINTTFPTVTGGDDNRAAYAFFGTPVAGNYTDPASYPASAPWHLYIATTFDGGLSWTTRDATPTDPVQRGTICNLGTTSCKAHSDAGIPDRNLLDFMGSTVDAQGRTVVGYPDGCVGNCVNNTTVTDPKQVSRTALASVARLSGGKRLFAAFDPNPAEPIAPREPRVDSVTRDGSGIVRITWSEPDHGGSPITAYNIYRRTQPGTYGAPIATVPANTNSYDDGSTDPAVTYFYKVTAVNGQGEGAACGEYPVTAPPPTNPCLLPGFLVVTDPTGDQTLAPDNADLDVQTVSIAEPFQTDGINRLIFTMKVASLATIPPNRQWYIIWTPPVAPAMAGTDRYYVAMKSTATGGPGSVSYEYGVVTSSGNVPIMLGAADAGSFSAAGLIQIAVANSKVGNPGPGAAFTLISGRNFAGTGNAAVTKSSAIDSTADGSYNVVGNAACRINSAPVAALAATNASGMAPLNVSFNASGSSDPDPGDSIASYTFNFGDGSAAVTQASAMIAHNYTRNGTFTATVSVTDSNGRSSTNIASVIVEVQSTLSGTVSRMTHGAAGTFDINLLLAGAQGIECRRSNSNGNYQLVFTFQRAVTSVANATVDQGTGSVTSRAADPGDARNYIVNLTGVNDVQFVKVTLTDVQDSAGANMTVSVPFGVLLGDVNADSSVNSADAGLTRNRSGQGTDATNFRADVNVDGTVNSADAAIVRGRSGNGLVAPR